jgi:hypothetical protein
MAGWTPAAVAATMATGSQHLIPGSVADVVGLLCTFQDHVHHLKDITGCTRILGILRIGGIPRFSRTWDTSLTKAASRPASVTQSSSTS